MTFPYRRIPQTPPSAVFGDVLLRPIIPLTMSWGGASRPYWALVDSGADLCTFDAELGELLGLDVRSGKQVWFGGVQEADLAHAYLHDVFLNISGQQHQTTVAFSYDLSYQTYGLLSQTRIFDQYLVNFDYTNEVIDITGNK